MFGKGRLEAHCELHGEQVVVIAWTGCFVLKRRCISRY
jgi:hypothetical protein